MRVTNPPAESTPTQHCTPGRMHRFVAEVRRMQRWVEGASAALQPALPLTLLALWVDHRGLLSTSTTAAALIGTLSLFGLRGWYRAPSLLQFAWKIDEQLQADEAFVIGYELSLANRPCQRGEFAAQALQELVRNADALLTTQRATHFLTRPRTTAQALRRPWLVCALALSLIELSIHLRASDNALAQAQRDESTIGRSAPSLLAAKDELAAGTAQREEQKETLRKLLANMQDRVPADAAKLDALLAQLEQAETAEQWQRALLAAQQSVDAMMQASPELAQAKLAALALAEQLRHDGYEELANLLARDAAGETRGSGSLANALEKTSASTLARAAAQAMQALYGAASSGADALTQEQEAQAEQTRRLGQKAQNSAATASASTSANDNRDRLERLSRHLQKPGKGAAADRAQQAKDLSNLAQDARRRAAQERLADALSRAQRESRRAGESQISGKQRRASGKQAGNANDDAREVFERLARGQSDKTHGTNGGQEKAGKQFVVGDDTNDNDSEGRGTSAQSDEESVQVIQESQTIATSTPSADGGGNGGAGDGAGHGSAPLADDAQQTGKAGKKSAALATPRKPEATRASILETASQFGLADENYAGVYHDYQDFSRASLERDNVPPAVRAAVARYFELITPRQGTPSSPP